MLSHECTGKDVHIILHGCPCTYFSLSIDTSAEHGEFVRWSFSFCDHVPAPRWYSTLYFVESVYDDRITKDPFVLPLFHATVIRTLSWFRDGFIALSIVGRQWSVTTLCMGDMKSHRSIKVLKFLLIYYYFYSFIWESKWKNEWNYINQIYTIKQRL